MKRLWLKISLCFTLLILGFVLVLWFLLATIVENTYTEMTRSHLTENAQLITQMIGANGTLDDQQTLQDTISEFRQPIDMRFTVVDGEGEVLADSENDPE